MSYLRIGPMKALVMSGTGRPQLAAAGYSIRRGAFSACAFWVHVGGFESSVRATVRANACSGRYVAACEGSQWIVYSPRADWSPDYEVPDALAWADHSRADDPHAPAHEAARAALILLVRRSWDLWSLRTSGDGCTIAAHAASRLDAALRDHHGRAVAKGDRVVVTVDGAEVAAVGSSADERELARIRERLRQRGWKV